jgi:hypothetical protein
MTQVPQNAPMSARVGAWFSPEVFATILAVPVVIVAVLVFLLIRGSPAPTGSAAVPPGPVATATAPVSPASAGPTSVPPSATPASSPAAGTATARVVLQLVDQLIANRKDLTTAVDARRPSAPDIADKLRAVAATLVALEQPLAELQQAPDTADLAARALAVTDATREAVTETQRASITNAAAYKAGGQKVVDVMEPLIAIRAELVVVVGPVPAP